MAGLVMAFWIGIGNFVSRMAVPTTLPPIINGTAMPLPGNMTTLITLITAKPKYSDFLSSLN